MQRKADAFVAKLSHRLSSSILPGASELERGQAGFKAFLAHLKSSFEAVPRPKLRAYLLGHLDEYGQQIWTRYDPPPVVHGRGMRVYGVPRVQPKAGCCCAVGELCACVPGCVPCALLCCCVYFLLALSALTHSPFVPSV